jgi:hypothetical protein
MIGSALIVIIGLLNFHIPHFILERAPASGYTDSWVDVVFAANVVGAIIAAVAIWQSHRWGWLLGLVVVGVSVALYVAQESVGLPGLPQNWLEPSRLVSLMFEVIFVLVFVAWSLTSSRPGRVTTSSPA